MGRRVRGARISALYGDGHSHPAADAETGKALLGITADHFMQQRHQDPATGRADGMTEGDGPAVDVDLRGVPSHLTVDRYSLRGKGLIDLHQVQLLMRPARLGKT